MAVDRIAIIIDASSLYHASRTLGMDVDFVNIKSSFSRSGRIIRAEYHVVVPPDDAYSSLRPLLDWLTYNGFTVVEKRGRYRESDGQRNVYGDASIAIAVSAYSIAQLCDHLILFVSNGDLRAAIAAVQRKGVRVTVVSTAITRPPMVADALRRQANQFLELGDLASLLCRTPRRGASRVLPAT